MLKNVPLKIKWPNDIFYKNDAKIGGILVKSSIMSDNLTVQIGTTVYLAKLKLNIFTVIYRDRS